MPAPGRDVIQDASGGRSTLRRSSSLPLAGAVRPAAEVAAGALAAVVLGVVVARYPSLAIAAIGVVAALWLLVRPNPAAIALGASIPAVENLAGGHFGVNVSLSDLLLLVLVAAVLGTAVISADAVAFRVLRPTAVPVLQYTAFVLVLLVAHPGFHPAIQTVQRLELVAFPLVAGSYLALKGAHIRLMQAYVVGATALAATWPFDHLQLQKNPAGQILANAILLVVGVPALRRLLFCTPILVYGLFATASRGAIVAGAIGLVVILLVQGIRRPQRSILQALALAAVVLAVFSITPASDRARITSFGSKGSAAAAFTVRVRQNYRADAIKIAAAHPWIGVGVGSYLSGVEEFGLTSTTDPHDVLLLQAAEGGWLFAVSFVVLLGGVALALIRLRHVDLAPAALAVLVATAAHGMVDVYWVRGTPILGWLLVGMTCALASRRGLGSER